MPFTRSYFLRNSLQNFYPKETVICVQGKKQKMGRTRSCVGLSVCTEHNRQRNSEKKWQFAGIGLQRRNCLEFKKTKIHVTRSSETNPETKNSIFLINKRFTAYVIFKNLRLFRAKSFFVLKKKVKNLSLKI